ncbi:MAG: uracil-DNA glycosylase family protein [Sphingobium sp.]
MMPSSVTTDPAALAASLAHWWALAGVDAAVSESPRAWLMREAAGDTPAPASNAPRPWTAIVPAAVEPPPVSGETGATGGISLPVAMPDDLDAYLAWLADTDQPEARFSRTRVLPQIVAGAAILLITDMPTADDMTAGALFSGAEDGLLRAMLRAIGLEKGAVSAASLLLARPAGGVMDDRLSAHAAHRLRRLIDLTAHRHIVILGDGTSRALERINTAEGVAPTSDVNHRHGSITPMLLPAPFVLLKHAGRKAAAWGQWRQLAMRP